MSQEYRLSDNAIAMIAKILQVALLTGTDVVDNLRMMRLDLDGDALTPTEESQQNFDQNIEKMLSELNFQPE